MPVKVAINGYGTIGKRVADAVAAQDDMRVIGVAKRRPTYEVRTAIGKGHPFPATASPRFLNSARFSSVMV